MKNLILKSAMAGLLIAFAGWIYLRCENKIVGAILFSIGLISVILLQANLYTGKIGYVDSKKKAIDALLILLFNLIAAYLVGLLYRAIFGTISFAPRLEKTWYRMLLDGVGCGILIYLAVELYRRCKSILVIILPVVAFILAGMEHSIADTFYFGATDFSWKGLLYVFLAIVGNSLGSLGIHGLQIAYEKLREPKAPTQPTEQIEEKRKE